ncbi:hypothetical protein SUGI_0294670 [Cryptomeria japonica]|nr:hypothetical protein SUGI_0294670 [Cryptomeria japonica]
MDVKSTFLNGILEEEVYIEQLDGYALIDAKDMVCKLHKALYTSTFVANFQRSIFKIVTTFHRTADKISCQKLIVKLVDDASDDRNDRSSDQKSHRIYNILIGCLFRLRQNVNGSLKLCTDEDVVCPTVLSLVH